MPADSSIYNAFAQPARSATDYANGFLSSQTQRQAIGVNALKMQGEQQTLDQQTVTNNERASLRSYVAGKDLSDPTVQQGVYQVAPLTGGAFIKSLNDNDKTRAETTHLGAQTQDALATAEKTKTEHAIAVQAQIAQAAGAATDQASWDRGLQIAKTLGADISQIPPQFDPATAKTIHDQALTGAQQLDAHFKQMTATETARHNQADESNTVRGQNVSASTSRANNSANVAKDYKVAGLDGNGNFVGLGGTAATTPTTPGAPGAAPAGLTGAPAAAPGTPAASPLQGLVDSIGKYKVPENVALARVPPAMRSQVLSAVQQQYSDYDPSTYGARQKAARDFSTGTQGNALRSFAVAGQHLDQLGTLADALDNGNVQIINKIGNTIAAQTGSTAPTNFDAAKDVVSKEVTKAIVAGGGGQAERAELAQQMSNAKTPAQLKGVISQYRNLMGAQHDALLQQRQAAGLPDSTLPAYSAGSPMTPGAFKITHVDGKPQ